MKVENIKTRVLTSGQRDGQKFMEKFDVVCAEAIMKIDGEERVITLSWISAAPEEVSQEVSFAPLADILCSDLIDEDLDRLDIRRSEARTCIANSDEIFENEEIAAVCKELKDRIFLEAVKANYISLETDDDDNGSKIEFDSFG